MYIRTSVFVSFKTYPIFNNKEERNVCEMIFIKLCLLKLLLGRRLSSQIETVHLSLCLGMLCVNVCLCICVSVFAMMLLVAGEETLSKAFVR